MQTRLVVAAAAVGLGLAWAMSRAATSQAEASDDGATVLDYANPWGLIEMQYQQHTTGAAVEDTNVRAFLTAIAWAEGTEKTPDPYRVCFGYRHTVQGFADHPANTGEWGGEKLTDQQCTGAGEKPGCVSTAAGRYQMRRATWNAAKRALSLPDFSPDSQDQAAVWLIDQRGALDDVKAGNLQTAIYKCRREWASLPGAGYAGQPTRRQDDVVAVFERAGGVVA